MQRGSESDLEVIGLQKVYVDVEARPGAVRYGRGEFLVGCAWVLGRGVGVGFGVWAGGDFLAGEVVQCPSRVYNGACPYSVNGSRPSYPSRGDV